MQSLIFIMFMVEEKYQLTIRYINWNFYRTATNKKLPLQIVRPGTQRRNFTHIKDVIDALIKIGEKGYGDEFGIGSSDSFNIIEVASMFKSEIEYLPKEREIA